MTNSNEGWIDVKDALPETFKFGGYLVSFVTKMDEVMQCVASFENVPQHCFENPPMHKRWFVYPSSGHEIYPTHWMPLPPNPTP